METKSRSSFINSCARAEEVKASNAANFRDSILSVRPAGGFRAAKNSSKRLTSQVELNLCSRDLFVTVSVKKVNTSATGAEKGHRPLEEHQMDHASPRTLITLLG